jgi:hypothetical protein
MPAAAAAVLVARMEPEKMVALKVPLPKATAAAAAMAAGPPGRLEAVLQGATEDMGTGRVHKAMVLQTMQVLAL